MLVTGLKMPEAYDGKCKNRNKNPCECGTPAVQEGHFIRTGKEKNRKDIEVWK